jgi:hypothetical protein
VTDGRAARLVAADVLWGMYQWLDRAVALVAAAALAVLGPGILVA